MCPASGNGGLCWFRAGVVGYVCVDVIEIKRRIKRMDRLPALPQLTREVIRSGPETADLEELAAIASFDPGLSRVLMQLAGDARSIRDAVLRLGLDALRRAILRMTLPPLFEPAGESALDRDAFWAHAGKSADYAAALARRVDPALVSTACCSAFLHNIGKLVLDLVTPETYASTLEYGAAGGRALLEAERRDLGVDHTLAGKWIAENWGLPEDCIAGIWLHHHPPGALDDTQYPVRLVELVRLAGSLAHASDEGTDSFEAFMSRLDVAVLNRLGIPRDGLRAAVLEVESLDSPAGDRVPGVAAAEPYEDVGYLRRLERRVKRLDTLESLHLAMSGYQSLGAVLDASAEAVRAAFGVSWGLCCSADLELSCLEIRWWSDARAPISQIVIPLGDLGPEEALDQALPAALEAVASGDVREACAGTSLVEVVRRPGFTVVPITHEGRSMGQIAVDAGTAVPVFTEDDFADLRLFGRAAGVAVARIRATQQLQSRTEEMVDALGRREQDFRRRLRAARLAGIAELAAGAAHEINNPLAVISGRAQMMLNRTLPPEDAKGLETIIDQSRRASKILTDLMQFARPPEPRLEPSVINFVLRQVVATMRSRLERQGIRIVEHYQEPLPRVRLDRRRIEQVFVHLIVNAEQAMAGKGGVLTLRTGSDAERRRVHIEIEDTGPGVPLEIRDRIFDPFFTTRGQGEGTGLGLAVCHGVLESHGGAVEVGGEPGRGAVFTVSLPVAIDLPAPVPQAPPRPRPETEDSADRPPLGRPAWSVMPAARHVPATPEPDLAPEPIIAESDAPPEEVKHAEVQEPAQPPTILVVDDDVDLREILRETFQGRGYRALGAANGTEAMALLVGSKTDVVIMDIRMPRENGIDVLRAIRAYDTRVPIILITGMVTEEELREANTLDIRACLHKPFELKRLLAEIEEVFGSRSAA